MGVGSGVGRGEGEVARAMSAALGAAFSWAPPADEDGLMSTRTGASGEADPDGSGFDATIARTCALHSSTLARTDVSRIFMSSRLSNMASILLPTSSTFACKDLTSRSIASSRSSVSSSGSSSATFTVQRMSYSVT